MTKTTKTYTARATMPMSVPVIAIATATKRTRLHPPSQQWKSGNSLFTGLPHLTPVYGSSCERDPLPATTSKS